MFGQGGVPPGYRGDSLTFAVSAFESISIVDQPLPELRRIKCRFLRKISRVNDSPTMKTGSRRWMAYDNKTTPPATLKYQNIGGTMLFSCDSLYSHWTKKRMPKSACPVNPTNNQKKLLSNDINVYSKRGDRVAGIFDTTRDHVGRRHG